MAKEYRFYFVDADNHIVTHRPCAAKDDLDALDKARVVVGRYEIEVWTDSRFVSRVARDGSAGDRLRIVTP